MIKSNEFVIRPATAKEVSDWYGSIPFTTTAYAGLLNGRVVALFGIYRTPDTFVAFCRGGSDIRRRKKDVVRIVRFFKELLQNYPVVVAWADRNEPTSHSLIHHVGFEFVRSTDKGELFTWRRQ